MGSSGGETGGAGLAQGAGTAIADNKAVRGDTPSGLQGSVVDISDVGVVSGVTQLNVDNVRVDGNTISAQNANGGLALTPLGSGIVTIGGVSVDLTGNMTLPSNTFIDGMNFVRVGGAKVALNRAGAAFSCGMALAFDRSIAISANATSESGFDVELYRAGIGVWQFGGGASGTLSSAQMGRSIEASTAGSGAPNILAVTESRKLLTNEGAAAEAFNTLPLAAAGVGPFGFYCQNTNGIRVTANTGDTIRIEGAVSAGAGFIRSIVVGSLIWLECVNSTEWVASCKPAGTWTIDI
jgi:hypothetical protein